MAKHELSVVAITILRDDTKWEKPIFPKKYLNRKGLLMMDDDGIDFLMQ